MHASENLRFIRRFITVITLCFLLVSPSVATNSAEATETNSVSSDTLRTYLQLQEQLHATQLALERNRQESETLAAKNAEAVAARFKAIEEALMNKRVTELESMKSSIEALERSMESNNRSRDSNSRMLITVAGTIAAVGFLVLLLTAYLQWRSVSRLAEFTAMVQSNRPVLPPGAAEAQLLGAGDVSQSGGRLSSALAQLERRIFELEHTTHHARAGKVIGDGAQSSALAHPNGAASENGHHEPTDHDAVLLAKGQSLLELEQPTEALQCFEEILRAEPDHAEALVKKGTALEQLRRMEEALECYDRAIVADGNLTIAYLQKGGLFNRMERYEEALQCYEQALHAQEKAHAS